MTNQGGGTLSGGERDRITWEFALHSCVDCAELVGRSVEYNHHRSTRTLGDARTMPQES